MERELPPWPQRVRDAVVQAASEVLPRQASLVTLQPTEAEQFWELALTPANDAAAPLHLFVEETGQGIDNFETGSRAASFELWEGPELRLDRVRQIVHAVIGGRCAEQIAFVGEEPVEVELTLTLPLDGETTYSRLGRSDRHAGRIEKRTFESY